MYYVQWGAQQTNHNNIAVYNIYIAQPWKKNNEVLSIIEVVLSGSSTRLEIHIVSPLSAMSWGEWPEYTNLYLHKSEQEFETPYGSRLLEQIII